MARDLTDREILAAAGLGVSDHDVVRLLRRRHDVEARMPFGVPLSERLEADIEGRVRRALENWRAQERLTGQPARERRALPRCMAYWNRGQRV